MMYGWPPAAWTILLSSGMPASFQVGHKEYMSLSGASQLGVSVIESKLDCLCLTLWWWWSMISSFDLFFCAYCRVRNTGKKYIFRFTFQMSRILEYFENPETSLVSCTVESFIFMLNLFILYIHFKGKYFCFVFHYIYFTNVTL